ncbi:hypothetical protein HK104_002417 [Borealophlyctis nickersoniae]|nr:hypothetical protein HK104_002417 [Borealophlyctis nickersoniae]
MSKLYLIPSSSVVVDRTSEPLGKGGFGTVRMGKWCGSQVAVKILSDQALTERELNDFRLEAETNHAIPRHANILAFFGIIDEPGHYALVMELMPKGSLFDLIGRGESLAWAERRRIARDTACGMFCLHEANVLHCDMKSLNVCMATLDFHHGICIELNVTSVIFVNHLCQKIITEPLYTKECDVFSYGITLTELFTMAGPYGVNYNELVKDILVDMVKSGGRPELPSDIPADLLDLVQECWAHDPKQRPPFSRIVERFDSFGSAPVYHSARDELYFTPPSHLPTKSSRNNDQNTAYVTPVTASGSGQSVYSTPSSSSPVSQASSGQGIDGENRASDSAPSNVESSMERNRLSPATQFPTPTATPPKSFFRHIRKQILRLSRAAQLPTPTTTPPPKSASTSSSESAAFRMNPTDRYELGRALDPDLGDEEIRNHSAALEWYHKAAIAGHRASQAVVGWKLRRGLGVEKNEAKAVEWYQKAAEQGDPTGQCGLGWCYQEGAGVGKDLKMAVHWYEKAAEQGHATAQDSLGYCYRDGLGVGKDETKAVEWYQKAADQENPSGQFNLGWCYSNGVGVGRNAKMAVHWYKKAAKQGHAPAQNSLGSCYQNGFDVEKDEGKAVEWYQKAADQGDPRGQFNLGRCYEEGLGVGQDLKMAVHWYEKAAKQGHASAQYNLGWCYDLGIGVRKDEKKAVEWYKMGAEQGDAVCQVNLASRYENGTGVAKDETRAVEWYRKAAAQGDKGAINALAELGVFV